MRVEINLTQETADALQTKAEALAVSDNVGYIRGTRCGNLKI